MTTTHVMASPVRFRMALLLAGPRQGWSSLVLLLVMLGATGLAIDEQRWVGVGPGGASQTGMLPMLMVAAGFTGALLSWSRLTVGWVDLLAAVAGTAAGLLLAAGAVSDATSVADRLRALNDALARFLHDILITGGPTDETAAFLLTISALAWTSGVFAAISIFRRSHAAGAIVPIGAILMLQVLASGRPQDIWLLAFAGASMLLVLRLDLEAQRDGWIRRRIGGGEGVGGLFLRGGAVVVAGMLVAALLLATTASTSSMSTAFPQVGSLLDDLASRLRGLAGVPQPLGRGSNGVFPEQRPITDAWTTSNELFFIAEPLPGDRHYWRAAAYDDFDGRTWRRTGTVTQEIPAGEDILGSSEDAVADDPATFHTAVATITSVSLAGLQLPAPQNPILLDLVVRLGLKGEDGTFQVLGLEGGLRKDDQYTVTGLEPAIDDPDGLTINRLIAGGSDHPDWIEPFRTVKPGSAGQRTIREAAAISDGLAADERDAYRLANTIEDLLSMDPAFQYSTNIRGVCETGETTSDCLLRTKVGFCQQYATAMTMMLRTLGVPARYVEGYLPGRPVPGIDGQFEVGASAAHAWVEVWFPDVGWIRFDPTPGTPSLEENGQQPTDLPVGPPIPTPGPSDDAGPDPSDAGETLDPDATDDPLETLEPDASPQPGGGGLSDWPLGGPGAWLIGLALVAGIALVAGGAGLLWFRRSPGPDPELAWRRVVGLASRLGVGPRPSQTPYEYTVTLSRVVPRAASDLRLVADAKVDASYSERPAGDADGRSLRDAYRRARQGLLRLLFRRGGSR